ncbi:MAG: hypothetical protein HGA86_04825, partial [Anaerolineaceae bacterium]|nr:hypothetical protein [Anaerolineaceae bacterium]
MDHRIVTLTLSQADERQHDGARDCDEAIEVHFQDDLAFVEERTQGRETDLERRFIIGMIQENYLREAQGLDVFSDNEIPPGRSWADFIEAKLEACKVMVVLWSS